VLYRETDPIAGKDCNSTSASSVIASGVSSAVAVNASGVSSSVSSLLTPNASVVTSKNSKFYCHTDNTDSKLLRLSFKIFDPEILNCNTITGSRSSAAGAFDGIILKNNYYNSNTSANTGAVCTNSELASKNCEKEFICIDKYANNTGTYEVKIKVKKNLGATQLINSIIEPVLFWLDGNPLSSNPNERIGFAEYIYKSLITNVIYVSILKMTMVLAIMFYGLGYLMGVSELSQTQIITRAFKIGFIYLFVGETGWQWFKAIFVDFYKDGVAQAVFLMTSAFNESPEIRQALDTNNFSNKAILFSGVDQVITILFSSAIHKKIWAFLFTGIFGWSYILIFYFSILNFIFALANSILLFLTAQVMISLLFIMGPLFLIFLLFSQTKDMFDNWLKAMTGFALQQIFLLTTLAFFNMLFVEVLKMSLGYGVCWDDAWVINLGLRFTITKFWVISSLPPRTNMSDDIMETGNPESIPSLFSILYIWVVASLMKKMVTLMTDVATSISDGIKASEIGQGIAAIGSKIKGAGASAASNALSSMTSGLDDKLFDSGSIAKKKRNALEDQAKSDMAARKTLLGAADEAEKAYKSDPNNIAKLGDMSKEEQNKEIQRVRSEAMDKKAAKMGIKGKNKERIINGTGLKYQGNNVFGALYQAGKQGIFTGGALKTSIADREGMGTKIGREEANKAAKSMNPQQAEKFAKDIAEGKINVERNRKEKAWDNKKRIGAAVLTGGLSELGLRANRAISDRVSQSRFGEIRKLAVSQLEEEGKIAKTGSTSMRTRNDDDQKMIRDRMRAIGDERKDKGKKDLGKKIGAKSSRSFRKRFNNKKKSLQKAINEALKNNDLDKYSKLSDIEDAINNAEFTSDDEDNYNSANELMNDFNKTDFDKNDSIDDLMSKDSFNNLKNK
jgi:type IV secretory pathway VirB6-like protein